ncbi:radical SAM protein [Pelagicoccus sp. SDUM812002]|uniref:radical SAM protein n=1 Tax=Pelagicoccus sp. SDUM812002 TaxID=3041266 RepID=UPI00280F2293|nr:radical SAM protein [Pelagicoccus sp. SDUM812002]MDQ8185919.1 radical SAM protein [Pelagicoccus sp. SDUM812002]
MANNFEGHIDHSGNGSIFGWARMVEEPKTRLHVKLSLSNGWTKTILANDLREDLAKAGIGDGRYGFHTKVPYRIASRGEIKVSCQTIEGDFKLEKSGRRLELEYPISLVAGDITNNCNLRCPFCVTDYALVKGMKSMSDDVFSKAAKLLPLVPDGMFWLSCMHEASVHPNLMGLIESVPPSLRKKISFTTNLCKKMDDEMLKALASSNIHSIRISIDSMDPERFAALRKGGRLETFLDNLSRLSSFMIQNEEAPKIRYISMVFENNVHEMPALIQKCKDILPAGVHEIRFIFYQPHIAKWGQKNLLSSKKWNAMKDRIQTSLGMDHVEFFDPLPDTHKSFEQAKDADTYRPSPAVFGGTCSPTNYRIADPITNQAVIPDEPLSFRLRWDGLISHEKIPENDFLHYVQNLSPEYFIKLREASQIGRHSDWQREPLEMPRT